MKPSLSEFLTYVKNTKSKSTLKSYKCSLGKFAAWYGASIDEILQERLEDWSSGDMFRKKRFFRKLEEFHKALLGEGYTLNSCRTYCLALQQIFAYYEMPVRVPTGSDVTKSVMSTKDYVPRIEEYRLMFKLGDIREKLFISLGLTLGWRIGDVIKLKKNMLPDLEQDAPIPFELLTEKENVVARSFIGEETRLLLKDHIAACSGENPYLFPSNGRGHIDPETITRSLRALAKKAKIRIPETKRLRFHCFRKRFISTCADLNIDPNITKILVGKSVEKSMLAYLSGINRQKAFERVYQFLRLGDVPTMQKKASTSEMEARLERVENLIHVIIGIGGQKYVERAQKILDSDATLSTTAILDALAMDGKRERDKEYEKMLRNNNNNNHE